MSRPAFRHLLAIDVPLERPAPVFSSVQRISSLPGLHTIAATLNALLFRFTTRLPSTRVTVVNNPNQMKQHLFMIVLLVVANGAAIAQTKPTATPSPGPAQPTPVTQGRRVPFELSEYGVSFQSDPRLIIVMAALDAAGFEPTPAGREPSVFRTRVRKDQAELDPALRLRLRNFFERNQLPAPATAADQAARYVSLAYVIGPPPSLDIPERSEDLPGGVLEVLDFAPLVREFYRKSGIDERLVSYRRAYQAEGDRLRQPVTEMVRTLLSYLHTRPITVSAERVLVRTPTAGKKKPANKVYTTREHERHFYIVPDLLAAPAATNLRVIADDYYAIVPEGADPAASELQRGYLQYVIDPFMLRFNKEIAARREPVRQLLKEREEAGATVTPDVFIAVSRSLVAAADARFNELVKLRALANAARNNLAKAKDEAARATVAKESQAAMTAVQDETVANLADEYERGAVLAFFFADQLLGIESTGFDVTSFFPDMIAAFDPARETRRPAEYAAARARALAARQTRLAKRNEPNRPPIYSDATAARAAALVKALAEIEETLRQKDYNGAETRLRALLPDYPREPRVFFAIAQTWSVAAADATDEVVQAQRLNSALSNYRLAVQAASPETDRALLSRAHEGMGRIHEFLGNRDEAAKEFDEAIKIDEVPGGAYKQALEGRKRLVAPQ
jgi:hypothetical protein